MTLPTGIFRKRLRTPPRPAYAEHVFGFTAPLLRKSCRRAASIPPDPGRRPRRVESWPHDTQIAEIRGSPATRARMARNPSPPEVALAQTNCGQAQCALRHAAIPINRLPTAGRARRTSLVQADGLVKRGSGPDPCRCPATAAAPTDVACTL